MYVLKEVPKKFTPLDPKVEAHTVEKLFKKHSKASCGGSCGGKWRIRAISGSSGLKFFLSQIAQVSLKELEKWDER